MSSTLTQYWEVLAVFLIPFGGGIPAGVVVAKNFGIEWPITAAIYLISDCILACVFEVLLKYFTGLSYRSAYWGRVRVAMKMSLDYIVKMFGIRPTPFNLIVLSVGTDPMTGRMISKLVGHGFFSGWTLAIMGDMVFYFIVMASTLWLNQVLGSGTQAAIIMTVAILAIPPLIQRLRA